MGESIVYAIKTALIVAFTAVFITAIVNITVTIVEFTGSTVLGEIMGIISMCLPFDVLAVFTAILSALDVIITFIVARKVYEIMLKSTDAS